MAPLLSKEEHHNLSGLCGLVKDIRSLFTRWNTIPFENATPGVVTDAQLNMWISYESQHETYYQKLLRYVNPLHEALAKIRQSDEPLDQSDARMKEKLEGAMADRQAAVHRQAEVDKAINDRKFELGAQGRAHCKQRYRAKTGHDIFNMW
ncbi:hypothetical protein LTR09_011860 [Extremus antarcticus]|uniref:Uncharacterized protein n=1 Tax=Extremus antarcticus TaxID=702011 RepID=A0AAJ0DB12_9PEZI|nr:hypothetical protein LTR09_011860 [Extremus antarcticus]